MMTAYHTTSLEQAALQAGATTYLREPFVLKALAEMILLL